MARKSAIGRAEYQGSQCAVHVLKDDHGSQICKARCLRIAAV